MKAPVTPRLRRRRPGTSAAAYSHALAVLGEPAKAQSVTITAVRRGGHSRNAILAHARHLSLQQADSSIATSRRDQPAAADLREVASQLADTRPPLERAVVDLELRYGLDNGSFARVLGLPTERATERAQEISSIWATALDPALMAWLGPGTCGHLEEMLTKHDVWPHISGPSVAGREQLAATGTEAVRASSGVETEVIALTVGTLVDIAPMILDHAAQCDVCDQRLRLLTPVRTVVGQVPVESPPTSVVEAARIARRRLAGPLPPSIEPKRFDISRLRTPFVVAAVVVVIASAAGGIVFAMSGRHETQAERVAKLIQSAPSSRLLGTPTIITSSTHTAALANNGTEPVVWHASANVPWLSVQPTDGRLLPSQSISIAVNSTAPGGGTALDGDDQDAIITITGNEGSKQTLRYDAS